MKQLAAGDFEQSLAVEVGHLQVTLPECRPPAGSAWEGQVAAPPSHACAGDAGMGRSGLVTTRRPECTRGGVGNAASYG